MAITVDVVALITTSTKGIQKKCVCVMSMLNLQVLNLKTNDLMVNDNDSKKLF
jgi:hypothetical protein